MATLTAVSDIATATIQLTGSFPEHPEGTEITVYRVLPDGSETPIRGGNPVLLSGFGFVLYDNEAPLNTAVYYRATTPGSIELVDTFTRVVAAGSWGIATSGQTWNGAASQLSVNGTVGLVTHDAANQTILADINPGANIASVRLRGHVRCPVVATGAPFSTHYRYRLSGGDFYGTGIQWMTTGVATLAVFKSIGGVITTLGTADLAAPYTGAETIAINLEAVGTTIRARAWFTTSGEPVDTWMVTITNATDLTTGTIGIRSSRSAGNTNGTQSMRFDNLRVYDLDQTEEGISGTVVLAAAPDGWIKSPSYPLDNLRLDNCDVHSPQCLDVEQNVFFQRLDTVTYRSATGVFDIIGDPRPNTVAMPRKAQTVGLIFVSRQLSSIPAIEALFAPGSVLLLQLPQQYGWGTSTYGSEYVTVGDIDVDRIAPQQMDKPYRTWSVPLTVTRPAADISSGGAGGSPLGPAYATYDAMKADGYTYTQLIAFGNTYQQWAQGDWD